MTSAVFVATLGLTSHAHAQTTTNIATTGNITATAPAADAAKNGTTGTSATDAVGAGVAAVTYTGASVTGTVTGNVVGQVGGAGGTDTDGNGSGTANGGNGLGGGAGITFNAQTTPTLVVGTTFSVTGGAGGAGGSVTGGIGNGGNGANGGAGVVANAASGIITINGTGAIAGGAGGQRGDGFGGGTNGTRGKGGDGVTVSESTTINFGGAGTITGGAAAASGTENGSGIAIVGTGKTLTITGATGTIVGAGTNGLGYAIEIASGQTGNTITNAAIVGGTATGQAVFIDADTAAVNNTGTLQSGAGNAVDVQAGDTLTLLTNTGSGVIKATGGNAIRVAGTVTTITNSSAGTGGIRATTGSAISTTGSGNLDTVTNTGGLITSANVSTTTGGTIVLGSDVAGLTITGGTVENTGGGNVIAVTVDQTGALNSSAALTATATTNAVRFENAAATFVNTGAITGRITSSADTKVQTYTQNTGGSITGTGTVIDLNDGADIVNLNAGTITGNIDLGAGGDTFTYANATSATGLVGTLAFGAGTNTFNVNESMTTGGTITSTAGTTNATVAVGKTFTANHAVGLGGGTFTNNGTTVIAAGSTITANADVVGASGKYIFGVSNATAANGAGAVVGLLDISGGAAQSGIDALADIEIQATSSAVLSDGAQFRIIHGAASETFDFTGQTLTDNSVLFNFLARNGNDGAPVTFTGADANDIIVEVDRADAATITGNASVVGIDAALVTIGSTGGTEMNLVQGALTSATTVAELNNIYEALAPASDNGAQTAAISTSGQVMALAENRAAEVRGQASGSEDLPNRFWFQAFGKTSTQDKVNNIDGYDADTYGGAAGVDGLVGDGAALVGAALSYGNTQVDADNANRTETDIDSYQVTLYGDYNFGEGTFVEGLAAYAWNNVESLRKNVGGVAGLNASADYDASTYAVRGAVGHSFSIGATSAAITPKVYAEYAAYDPDNYTETGAGGANLRVDGDSSEQLNLGLNVELSNKYVNVDGSLFKPSINVGYKHDVIGDEINTTSTFVAGGGAFTTAGADSEDGTFMAGVGLDYYSTGNWQFTAQYDYELKDNYDSHAGFMRAGYRF